MKKHEWRVVTGGDDGYGWHGPSLTDWLYQLENEGWEIVTVSGRHNFTIVCRKPFIPAVMRS